MVELAALPEVVALARQASHYSDSLFLQPLISFFILSFRLEGIEQTRYKTRNSNTCVPASQRAIWACSGTLLLCISRVGNRVTSRILQITRGNGCPRAMGQKIGLLVLYRRGKISQNCDLCGAGVARWNGCRVLPVTFVAENGADSQR